VAYWTVSESGEARLVNRQGEVFVAASNADMPQFDGPQGSSGWLLAAMASFPACCSHSACAPGRARPVGARGLAAQLDNGLTIMLGREQDKSTNWASACGASSRCGRAYKTQSTSTSRWRICAIRVDLH
jgi:cell division protein FtsQ